LPSERIHDLKTSPTDHTANLAGVTMSTSRLGYGSARLHHLRQSSERQTLLSTAYDLGIRHFDTAPLYGHGLAEHELGKFLRGKRDFCAVATKYGIPLVPWIASAPAKLRRPAIILRTIASRAHLARDHRPTLSAEGLRASVDASLRRMDLDYLDLHMLHEPDPGRLGAFDDIVSTYQDLKTEGKIVSFGLAGSFEACKAAVERAPDIPFVIQTAESDWNSSLEPDITYGAISSNAQAFGNASSSDRETVSNRLIEAMVRRPEGLILVSSTRPGHLVELAETVQSKVQVA